MCHLSNRIFENTSNEEKDFVFPEYYTNSYPILKRSNFGLNFNPYNLSKKKPDEENFDNKKQLKFLKKLAIEIPSNKIKDKNTENMKSFGLYSSDKVVTENDDKKLFTRN